jgi:thiosulfate dehydrogenase
VWRTTADHLHERPRLDLTSEYPKLNEKPVDYYFPPFADVFRQEQHKYGPFKPIMEWLKKNGHPTGY